MRVIFMLGNSLEQLVLLGGNDKSKDGRNQAGGDADM